MIANMAPNYAGKIIYANHIACELLGYNHTEILDTTILSLIPPYFRLPHKKFIEDFIKFSPVIEDFTLLFYILSILKDLSLNLMLKWNSLGLTGCLYYY